MKAMVNSKKWLLSYLIFFALTLVVAAVINGFAQKKVIPLEADEEYHGGDVDQIDRHSDEYHCDYVIQEDEMDGLEYAVITHCYDENEEVMIPSKIESYEVREIAMMACASCIQAKKIVVPDTVRKIGMQAFSGCWKLEELVIPFSVKELEVNEYNGRKFPIIDIGEQEIMTSKGSEKYQPKEVTIYTEKGSEAAKYAQEFGIKWEIKR